MLQNQILITIGILYYTCREVTADCSSHGNNKSGHKMPFGQCGPFVKVDEINGWPTMTDFTLKYVRNKVPLLMKNAAKMSPAFWLWTDEYFMTLDLTDDARVVVETQKKENRSVPATDMHFHDWIRTYKQTDKYMIEDVPYYLRKDILYPWPLQCGNLRKYLIKMVMWFSSGGTKSVAHTDLTDNIICVYRGTKTFTMVDTDKHGHKIPINRSFSPIDVDSVDFEKYPSMADDIEYYRINISAGDCLYIPYMWIHQVNSYDTNIAVNFWWSHYGFLLNDIASVGDCDQKPDCWLTVHSADLTGNNGERDYPYEILDIMNALVIHSEDGSIKIEDVYNIPVEGSTSKEKSFLHEAFKSGDLDNDGLLTKGEIDIIRNDKMVGANFRNAIRKYARLVRQSNENELKKDVKDEL